MSMNEKLGAEDLADIIRLLAICIEHDSAENQVLSRRAIIEILEDKPVVVHDLKGEA